MDKFKHILDTSWVENLSLTLNIDFTMNNCYLLTSQLSGHRVIFVTSVEHAQIFLLNQRSQRDTDPCLLVPPFISLFYQTDQARNSRSLLSWNNWTHPRISCDGRGRVTGDVAWRETSCNGRRRVTGDVAWRETSRDGRRRVTGDVVWRETSCDGRRRVTGDVVWRWTSCDWRRRVTGDVEWWETSCDGRRRVTWDVAWRGTSCDWRRRMMGDVEWRETSRDGRRRVTGYVAWRETLRDGRRRVTGDVAWRETSCHWRRRVMGDVCDGTSWCDRRRRVTADVMRHHLTGDLQEPFLHYMAHLWLFGHSPSPKFIGSRFIHSLCHCVLIMCDKNQRLFANIVFLFIFYSEFDFHQQYFHVYKTFLIFSKWKMSDG